MADEKKNEPKPINYWNRDDLEFIKNRTEGFVFNFPHNLERKLERRRFRFLMPSQTEVTVYPETTGSSSTLDYNVLSYIDIGDYNIEEGIKKTFGERKIRYISANINDFSHPPTPLEIFLRDLEDESKEILAENGLDPEDLEDLIKRWSTLFDPENPDRLFRSLKDDFPSLVSDSPTSMQLQNAAHISFCTDRVRNDISNGDAEQTAIDMAKLCFASCNANYQEMIRRGIRAKTGPAKGGRTPKKEEGFFLVARYALQNSKKKGSLSLWKYLKEVLPELELTGNNHFGNYEAVFEARKYKGASRNVISIYKKTGKAKDIGFRGFQRYVSDLKKKSQ